MAVRAFLSWGRADVGLYTVVEFFLKRLGNNSSSLAVLDNAPYYRKGVVYLCQSTTHQI